MRSQNRVYNFAIHRPHQISSNTIHIQNLSCFLRKTRTYSHKKAHKPFGQLQIEGSNGNTSRASLASLRRSWKNFPYHYSRSLKSDSVIRFQCFNILGICKVCRSEHRTAHLNFPPPPKVESSPDPIPVSDHESEISELSFLGQCREVRLIHFKITVIVCC